MISREELYELVWSKPMTKIAEQFDVSSSYMGRVCAILNVPRPERGYWAKQAVGKAPTRVPLPDAQPGDQLSWSRTGELPPTPKPRPTVAVKSVRTTIPKSAIHRLISGVKGLFESGRPVEEGSYIRPYKKLLVDITASKAGLDKALRFANDLFNALESSGHRVVLAPSDGKMRRCEIDEREVRSKRREHYHSRTWSPHRPTVVYVGNVAVGLAVIEMSEQVLLRYVRGQYIRESDYKPPKDPRSAEHTWTTTRDLPSGRLRLIAYSPYWRVSWLIDWNETKEISLGTALATIVRAIEKSAVDLVGKIEEAERQAEIEHQRWLEEQEQHRIAEDKREVGQSIRASQEQLSQIIQKWSEVMNVEKFLAGVAERASDLPDVHRDKIYQRLQLAREFLGSPNPLDFFLLWKTPTERYRPRYNQAENQTNEEMS